MPRKSNLKKPEFNPRIAGEHKVPQHLVHKLRFFDKMNEWGIPYETEHRFYPERLWRLDVAFPQVKVAVEIEGGTFTAGRHSRGAGMALDMEKYNTAASKGWLVLKASPAMLSDDDFLCLLFDTLARRHAIETNKSLGLRENL